MAAGTLYGGVLTPGGEHVDPIWIIGGFLGLGVAVLLVEAFRPKPPPPSRPEMSDTLRDRLSDHASRVAALEVSIQNLPAVWEEAVERASRHRERAEKAEYRSKKRAEGVGDPEADDPAQMQLMPGQGAPNGELPLEDVNAETHDAASYEQLRETWFLDRMKG